MTLNKLSPGTTGRAAARDRLVRCESEVKKANT